MTDASQVAVTCPSCSPDDETVHEVLKPGGQATVRCTACGHVHKTRIEEERTVRRDVVVSQGEESFTATVDVPADESVEVGDEFVLETEAAIFVVRVTSLEADGSRRLESATAEDVQTFWTRDVGNVSVNVTLHPKEGSHDETRSTVVHVPGDEEFVVAEDYELGDHEFEVEGILLRDTASGYDFDHLERPGDRAEAKDVKRIYARDEGADTWSAWRRRRR